MAHLRRASLALLLLLPPASAAVTGRLVLRQAPLMEELLGIALVIGGVAPHRAE